LRNEPTLPATQPNHILMEVSVMHTRAVEIILKSGKEKEFTQTFNERIVPVLQSQPGFVDVLTLRSDSHPNRIVGLSFWRTKEDAERYERDQWKSVGYILSYLVETEPTVQTFNVEASTVQPIAAEKAA
jgi:heme-degrading monooxygenase HmoA